MFSKVVIEYGEDFYPLTFELRPHEVAQLWANKLVEAQEKYPLDDPGRFYSIVPEQEKELAVARINKCIDDIDAFIPVVQRKLGSVDDQDTLNYLHSIFEKYHGLLDQQKSRFWSVAPEKVRTALSNLNLLIHRCEGAARGIFPRHVCTWFGLPKTDTLLTHHYAYFIDKWKPGTIFLNYVEIGKTLEDLAIDNDQYIGPDAFQPFRHYSADFVVKFYAQEERRASDLRHKTIKYYMDHLEKFSPWKPYYAPGAMPVADIVGWDDKILTDLVTRQYVRSISLK